MSSSSREKIVFRKKPIDVVIAVTEQPGKGPKPHSRLKELQRRAFERGAELERKEWTKKLEKLTADIAALQKARADEKVAADAEMREFAVRLASYTIEKLVHATVEEGRHDPKKMIEDVLAELRPREIDSRIEIHLNPDDHAHLLAALAEGSVSRSLAGAFLVADRTIARGSFVVHDDEATIYSMLSERLESLRTRLIEAARTVPYAGD